MEVYPLVMTNRFLLNRFSQITSSNLKNVWVKQCFKPSPSHHHLKIDGIKCYKPFPYHSHTIALPPLPVGRCGGFNHLRTRHFSKTKRVLCALAALAALSMVVDRFTGVGHQASSPIGQHSVPTRYIICMD